VAGLGPALILELLYSYILVKRYIHTRPKLEVPTAFLLRENLRCGTDGQTDGRSATFMRLLIEGRIFCVQC